MAFENSLYDNEPKTSSQSLHMDLQTPLFDKALLYSTSSIADASRDDRLFPGIQQMSRRFFTMSEQRRWGRYNQFLSELNPASLSEITTIIDKACRDLDVLCHANPDMAIGFRTIQGALELYLSKLRQLSPATGEPSETIMLVPSFFPGSGLPPTPASMSRSTSRNDYEPDSPWAQVSLKMTGLPIHCLGGPGSAFPGLASILGDESSEVCAASLALSGWIYCGQTITPNFGVYFRAFIMLLRVVQSSREQSPRR